MPPRIDFGKCDGCGRCYAYCPQDVFGWDTEKRRPTIAYSAECTECGTCELECHMLCVDVYLPYRYYDQPKFIDKKYFVANR